MLAPGGESHGRTGEASRGSSVPEPGGQTGRGAEPGTSDTERGNPILAWLSRNLCLGMREECKTRKRIEREIQASSEAYEKEEEQLRELAAKLEESSIRRHEDAAAHRLRAIEDKARVNLLSITIGVAVLFAGLDLLAGGGIGVRLAGWLQVSVALGFVASVLYFLLGGLMALKALEVARVFVPSLEEEAERSEVERAMQGLWVLEQNEKTIFLRTNALSSSSYGLRNGVFCLTALVVLLAGSIVFLNLRSPVAKPSDRAAPSGEVDSVRPAAPAPSPDFSHEPVGGGWAGDLASRREWRGHYEAKYRAVIVGCGAERRPGRGVRGVGGSRRGERADRSLRRGEAAGVTVRGSRFLSG